MMMMMMDPSFDVSLPARRCCARVPAAADDDDAALKDHRLSLSITLYINIQDVKSPTVH